MFEMQARQIYGDRLRINSGPRVSAGRDYRVRVTVPVYDFTVPVRISFMSESPYFPNVILPPDESSPHRYNDPSVPCMWYPKDPPRSRWIFKDGLYQLLLHVEWHLYRETVYHETGDWPGDEAPHAPHRRSRR